MRGKHSLKPPLNAFTIPMCYTRWRCCRCHRTALQDATELSYLKNSRQNVAWCSIKSDLIALVLPDATNYITMLQNAWWQRIGSIIFGRKSSYFAGANGAFFIQPKAGAARGGGAGVGLKDMHSHVRDSTDRKQLNTYKTKQPNTKWIKKYMYHIIQYDTKRPKIW